MDIKFRLAGPRDAGALKTLNDQFNGVDCNTEAGVEASLRHNTQEMVCVAEAAGRPVGFCCGQLFKSMCYGVNYAEITELYVADAYRRGGVGKGLLVFLESEFQKQGIRDFQLFTGEANRPAQIFYSGCGYRRSAELIFRKRIWD